MNILRNVLPRIQLVSCTLAHDIPIKATLISQRSNTQPSHYVLVRCGIFCPYCMCYYSRLFIRTLARYFIRYASTRNLLSLFSVVSSNLRDLSGPFFVAAICIRSLLMGSPLSFLGEYGIRSFHPPPPRGPPYVCSRVPVFDHHFARITTCSCDCNWSCDCCL